MQIASSGAARAIGLGARIPGVATGAAPAAPQADPPAAKNLKVAQFNLYNLFDTVDNPRTGDTVLTKEQYKVKLQKIALSISKELGAPDVLSLNEIENETCLDDLIAMPGLKELGYKYVMSALNDERGIRTAVMYRSDRLEQVGVESPNPKMSFPDRGKGQIDTSVLYARPPLAVDFRVRGAAQAAEGAGLLTVVVNHFKSKLGGDGPEARRQMQGQYLGEWVDARRAANPANTVLVVGDLNANFGDGAYEKLATRKDGTNRMFDTMLTLPEDERYSYIYHGQKNALDHMLVDAAHKDAIVGMHHARVNTIPDSKKYANDPTTAKGVSDHDMMVTEFDLAKLLAAAK